MDVAIYLIPVGIIFAIVAGWALYWSINNKQYDDLDGAAHRILHDDE